MTGQGLRVSRPRQEESGREGEDHQACQHRHVLASLRRAALQVPEVRAELSAGVLLQLRGQIVVWAIGERLP